MGSFLEAQSVDNIRCNHIRNVHTNLHTYPHTEQRENNENVTWGISRCLHCVKCVSCVFVHSWWPFTGIPKDCFFLNGGGGAGSSHKMSNQYKNVHVGENVSDREKRREWEMWHAWQTCVCIKVRAGLTTNAPSVNKSGKTNTTEDDQEWIKMWSALFNPIQIH